MMATGAAVAFAVTTLSHSHSLGFLAGALAAGAPLACLRRAGFGLSRQSGRGGACHRPTGSRRFRASRKTIRGQYNSAAAEAKRAWPCPPTDRWAYSVRTGHSRLLGLALIAVLAWIFKRTKLGLIIRAVGEAPTAARDIGYPVVAIRFACVAFGGLLAGIGGAYLSIAYTALWTEGLVAGRGWIAVALVVFGSWIPLRIAIGAYVFGAISLLELSIQGLGLDVPSQFLSALPYIATIVVLAVAISRDATYLRREPAALTREGFCYGRMISHLTGEVCMTVTHRFLGIAFALAIAMLGVGSASAQKAKIGVISVRAIGEVG